MNHMKRSLAAVGLTAVAALVVAGCSAGSGPAESSGPIEIEYLGWVSELQDAIDIWNKENPDIQVKLRTTTGSDEANPAIRAGVQAGNAPCMAQMAYFSLPNFVADDLLMPITDVAAQYQDKFLDWTWASASAGGEVYGIPQDSGPMVMYYNQDEFAKFGIEVPTTWEEYAADAAKVKAQDPTVSLGFLGPDDVGAYAGLVAQAGGRWTTIDGDEWKVGINDTGSLKVANFWQDLLDKKLVTITPRYDAGLFPQLIDHKILSFVGASWNYTTLPDNVPDQAGQWRVAQMPKWEGSEDTANHGGSASVVLKGCKHPAEAAKFATWLNSSDESMDILIRGGLYPAANDAFNLDVLKQGVDYYGGQVVYDEFAASAKNVDTSWTFGPTYDATATAYTDGLASVASGQGTFVDVANDVQKSTLADMKDRGISASAE
ncbi:ABC transporter substrate-binding protein [uncultured Microbacterium sp.]|uniref:ABC transporter substrate-binding protein n=1 Tax=uncultured Microbacterium sp. TaxID=191216 RepID=UPI0035CA9736